MSYTAQPLPDLWYRLAQNEAFSAFSLVRDTAAELSHHPFSDAFSVAVQRAEEEGLLLPTARQLLTEFAEGCGHTDLAGQQAHIDYYRRLLSAEEETARRHYAEKGRMYRVLGLTSGIALMLLLT
ncbi:MAG: stage III sporulation protein AB [Clostridia bacterium]|nr:stage III sporulation protein AB [Clostridia bacterium]